MATDKIRPTEKGYTDGYAILPYGVYEIDGVGDVVVDEEGARNLGTNDSVELREVFDALLAARRKKG